MPQRVASFLDLVKQKQRELELFRVVLVECFLCEQRMGFAMSEITRRRADEFCDLMAVLEFCAIYFHHCAGFTEERFQLEKSKDELEWKLKDRKEVAERQLTTRQKEIHAIENEIHRAKAQRPGAMPNFAFQRSGWQDGNHPAKTLPAMDGQGRSGWQDDRRLCHLE